MRERIAKNKTSQGKLKSRQTTSFQDDVGRLPARPRLTRRRYNIADVGRVRKGIVSLCIYLMTSQRKGKEGR